MEVERRAGGASGSVWARALCAGEDRSRLDSGHRVFVGGPVCHYHCRVKLIRLFLLLLSLVLLLLFSPSLSLEAGMVAVENGPTSSAARVRGAHVGVRGRGVR